MRWVFSLFAWYLEKSFRNYYIQKTKMSRSINDSLAGVSYRMVTKVNLIDKLHADLANWSVLWASQLTYILTWRFAVHLNRSLVELVGFSYREDRSCICQVVPLHSCKKDISSHLRSFKFSDPENEVDLFLSRAGVTADLNRPRIWTLPILRIWNPFRKFGPPYQTLSLSIFCIIFGN